ncbi:MAG: GNAT family N-acetyltransferase [Alphaproteobacteria bacterium]|nr:GNAT family N-acetyltransferase [Alphaproteobacteria bacterium]
MPDGGETLAVRVLGGIADVPAEAWDACAGPDNPFVGHAFLRALEDSGSAVARTGWQPRHLTVTDRSGAVIGAAPLYLKSHSYGEYVFDWAWADAFERAGGKYYPKLLVAAPFSPVTGPRLLCPESEDETLAKTLLAGMVEAAKRLEVSSLHIIFPSRAEWEFAGRCGFLLREGKQFHWENDGYHSFNDFLGRLASRKRKNIRKERARAVENDIEVRRLTGAEITPAHWDAFYRFYMDTASRKWGHPYLNREFFEELGARLADHVLLVMAFRDGHAIAGALNLFSDDAIFGRNWGCLEDHPFLHFECCYYQAIDFAIERGLSRVEAGAGGRHKVTRGYMPAATYSAHWIADEGFRNAVARFLSQERTEIDWERRAMERRAPFRKGDGDGPPPSTRAPRSEEDEEGF